ncbi:MULTISPECIES: ribonuclease E inhibitor RraB [Bacillaceae]|uniref:ribonuclease E inhibitor RraB n=1 Tax=Shouchella oshimensis TaxID=290588 RepID=UPI0006EC2F39|nr:MULTISPECIES: ribonuclease E inhibitor RraB [Bacillaceae]
MERSKQVFSYKTEVDPETEIIYGHVTMMTDRKAADVPYYVISDEVFAVDEDSFADKPGVNDLLGMLEFFYTESDRLLDTVVVFPQMRDDLIRMEAFADWLQQWQRYFYLSNVKDIGFIVSHTQPESERFCMILEELGFEEMLSSEEEHQSFYFYNVTYITPVDFPNDDDGAVLQSLKDSGVDMSKPREVEFILLCPNRRSARKVAKLVELEGYEVDVDEDEEHEEFVLVCKKVIHLTHAEIVKHQHDLEEITARYEVKIDGWGAMVD